MVLQYRALLGKSGGALFTFSIAAAPGWEITASIDAVNSGRPSPRFASFAATIARWLCNRCILRNSLMTNEMPQQSIQLDVIEVFENGGVFR